MRHLTIRRVPDDLAAALDAEKRRRGTSLNRTVLDLLQERLGTSRRGKKSNGLARFSGTWTEEQFEEFQKAIAFTEQIDEELWR